MRKLMCIIIAICLTATMGITITAVQTTDVQLSETIMQTYNYDGRPAYYIRLWFEAEKPMQQSDAR